MTDIPLTSKWVELISYAYFELIVDGHSKRPLAFEAGAYRFATSDLRMLQYDETQFVVFVHQLDAVYDTIARFSVPTEKLVYGVNAQSTGTGAFVSYTAAAGAFPQSVGFRWWLHVTEIIRPVGSTFSMVAFYDDVGSVWEAWEDDTTVSGLAKIVLEPFSGRDIPLKKNAAGTDNYYGIKETSGLNFVMRGFCYLDR